MAKKIVSLITLAAFIYFNTACVVHRVRPENIEDLAPKKPEKVEIFSLQKKSGERIYFPDSLPAKLSGDVIVGSKRIVLDIPSAEIKHKKWKGGRIHHITTTDGKYYYVNKVVREEKGKFVLEIFDLSETEFIPLSEVQVVWVKKADPFLSGLAIGVPIVLVIGLAGVIGIAFLVTRMIKAMEGS